MIRANLKLIARTLAKNFSYTILNTIGLAISMTVSLLIFMYVANELSYESMHDRSDRIYRVASNWGEGGQKQLLLGSYEPLGPALAEDLPEVENYVRVLKEHHFDITTVTGELSVNRAFFMDSTVFDVFSFELAAGNPGIVLSAPYSVVVTDELAHKLFDDGKALGRTITLDGEHQVTITGILANIESNTMLDLDMMVSYSTLEPLGRSYEGSWGSSGHTQTFILVAENTDIDLLPSRITSVIAERAGEFQAELVTPVLHALPDIHLTSSAIGEIGPTGNRQLVYILLSVAILVLLVACFNYINLATARSTRRRGEIGMRKILGASRASIAIQVMSESMLLAFISAGIGLACYEMFIPTVCDYLQTNLLENESLQMIPYVFAASLALLVGLLAGLYPSFALSGTRGVRSQVHLETRRTTPWLRRAMIVSQFTISSVLIVFTMVVLDQLSFMRSENLGFNKENVVLLNHKRQPGEHDKYSVLKEQIESLPEIASVSGANSFPGVQAWTRVGMRAMDAPEEDMVSMRTVVANPDYIETLGLSVLLGRSFAESELFNTTSTVMISESAIDVFGFDEPVGEQIYMPNGDSHIILNVIGVVKDFHLGSMRSAADPVVIYPSESSKNYLALKLNTEDMAGVMAKVENIHKEVLPDQPYSWRSLEDTYNSVYSNEQKTSEMLGLAAILAIVISCLGMLGLAAFMTEQRTRELSIRKVFGARVSNLMTILSTEFVYMVLIANLIACPMAYMLATRWLNDFAYRIEPSPIPFVLTAIMVLAVAVMTISVQVFRASTANPIDTLRAE